MEEHVESFMTVTEDGEEIEIHVYQSIVPVPTRGNPSATMRGMRALRTAHGEPVRPLEEGRYLIVHRGIVTRLVDQ